MTRILAAVLLLVGMAGAAAACPNWQYNGRQAGYTTGQDLWTPNSYSVVAGGDQALQNCGFNHTGYVISQPDFEFRIDGLESYQTLNIRTSGGCDTVLLVNDSSGTWYFDDDSAGGTNASININRPGSGTFDIWVGTYSPGTCNATLTLETF